MIILLQARPFYIPRHVLSALIAEIALNALPSKRFRLHLIPHHSLLSTPTHRGFVLGVDFFIPFILKFKTQKGLGFSRAFYLTQATERWVFIL